MSSLTQTNIRIDEEEGTSNTLLDASRIDSSSFAMYQPMSCPQTCSSDDGLSKQFSSIKPFVKQSHQDTLTPIVTSSYLTSRRSSFSEARQDEFNLYFKDTSKCVCNHTTNSSNANKQGYNLVNNNSGYSSSVIDTVCEVCLNKNDPYPSYHSNHLTDNANHHFNKRKTEEEELVRIRCYDSLMSDILIDENMTSNTNDKNHMTNSHNNTDNNTARGRSESQTSMSSNDDDTMIDKKPVVKKSTGLFALFREHGLRGTVQ